MQHDRTLAGSEGTLGIISIRGPHDFVLLSRRVRAAGEDLGLQSPEVRRLSAATYEAARLLASSRGIEAEIRLADAPGLQVVFRVPFEPGVDPTVQRAEIERGLTALRPLVHLVEMEDTEHGVCVSLMSVFPAGAVQSFRPLPSQPLPLRTLEEPGLSQGLFEQHIQLQNDYRDLQLELQDTNRGVIAVYAELADQADRLRQAEDRLRLLLDSVLDYAICMLSPDGEVTSWNAGGERLFGYSADEIIGRHFECFYATAEQEQRLPAEHLSEARKRGRYEGECLRVRKNGSRFDAHVVLTPVHRNRDLRGYSLVVRDITERKRLENDLRRRAEDLAAANRAKEDFLATLSHELRTPLNAMLGWTRLLRMGKLDQAAVARALETIERNAHAQEQLIADILDVSRIVTGKLRLELAPIELAPVVDAAVDAVRPAAQAKGIRLTAAITFPGTVLGDSDRLQQVLWNLLVNAIKFTPPGGNVSTTLERVSHTAVIRVTDSGEGISEELLPFIFDRFRQGDGSVTRSHGGLGLGLSIVRHIVELHGGKVQAQSEGLGRGASFSVHLPLRVSGRQVTSGTPHAGSSASRSSR